MTLERAQKIRTVAARWRGLLEDVLAPRPLTADPKNHTALQHGAQVKENIALALPQLQEVVKGDAPAQIILPLSGHLTDSAIANTADANALSYHLADSLGQIADSVERLAASNQTIDTEVEQLLAVLLEDTQDRAWLVEQSYDAYRQQQAQQQ